MTTSSRHNTTHSNQEWDVILRMIESVFVCVCTAVRICLLFFNINMRVQLCVCLFACEVDAYKFVHPDLVKIYQCVGGTVPAEGGQRERGKANGGQGREKHSVRSIASLWSDIITCSSPGCSPRLACVWKMASHINITRYPTCLRKKVDKVKMHFASGT